MSRNWQEDNNRSAEWAVTDFPVYLEGALKSIIFPPETILHF